MLQKHIATEKGLPSASFLLCLNHTKAIFASVFIFPAQTMVSVVILYVYALCKHLPFKRMSVLPVQCNSSVRLK